MDELTTLHLKISKKDADRFRSAVKKFNRKISDVLRELIQAYNERRLTITPSKAQINEREEIYDNRKQA